MTTARSLRSPAPYTFDAVIVGLHLRWDGVYQRPQHILTRVAKHVPVFIVEEPFIDSSDLLETIVDGDVTIYRPHRREPPADALDDATLNPIRMRLARSRPLVWLYTPMMCSLADTFADSPLVFDAMDELAKFAHCDPRLAQRESEILERASMVFCGGPSLYRSRAGRARNVRLHSSGVDVAFFERARHIAAHPALARRNRPVFGYVGVIDERIDLELIAAIAEARPDAELVLIGPVAKIDPATLPQGHNITYLGQQKYADLPALLAGFDIALMPFALNESTVNISPTKTLEYLAAGKPVVSTAVPDVVSEYAGIVTIVRDHQSFIEALSAASTLDPARCNAADAKTYAATWDAIAASMLHDLAQIDVTPQFDRRPIGSFYEASPRRRDHSDLLCSCAHTVTIHDAGGCSRRTTAECDCRFDCASATAAAFSQSRDANVLHPSVPNVRWLDAGRRNRPS